MPDSPHEGPIRGRQAPHVPAAMRQEIMDKVCCMIATCGRIPIELPPDSFWSIRDRWFDVYGTVDFTGVTDWTNVVAHTVGVSARGILTGFGQDINDLTGFEANQIEWRIRIGHEVSLTYPNFRVRLGGVCEGRERPTRLHVPPGMTVALQARNVSANNYTVAGTLVGYDILINPKDLDPSRGIGYDFT